MNDLVELGWRLPALAAMCDAMLPPVAAVATFDDPAGAAAVGILRGRLAAMQRDRDALVAESLVAADLLGAVEARLQSARVSAGLPAPTGGESSYCRALLSGAAAVAEGVRGCLLRLGAGGVTAAEPLALVNVAGDLVRLGRRLPPLEPLLGAVATELSTARAANNSAGLELIRAQVAEAIARQTQTARERAADAVLQDGWSADGLSLRWGGELFTMTASAAAVVRLLVDAFRRGEPLSEQYLKTESDVDSDLRTLVRDNALGELVVPFSQHGRRRKGFWAMVDPKKKSDPR